MGENNSIVKKLLNIDDRIIYLIMMFVFSVPLLVPLGLPIEISEYPRKTYDFIESLEPGSIVAISYDVGPGDRQDAAPAINDVLRHVIRNPNVRAVVWSISPNGPMLWEEAIADATKEGQEYGIDYVYLGYIPGEETASLAIATNTWDAFNSRDAYGTPFSELPLMEEFRGADDAAAIIMSGSSMQFIFGYIRQWQDTFGITMIATGSSKFESTYVAFLATDQIYSVIAGSTHAAQYELLLDEPGLTIASMDAQSISHIVLILFMILGNALYLIQRQQGGKK